MRKRTYTSKENAVCKECAGEGSIINAGEHQGHGRFADTKLEQCPVCLGSGMVTVEKITVVTITPKLPMS